MRTYMTVRRILSPVLVKARLVLMATNIIDSEDPTRKKAVTVSPRDLFTKIMGQNIT